jgi:hypothetical protein
MRYLARSFFSFYTIGKIFIFKLLIAAKILNIFDMS